MHYYQLNILHFAFIIMINITILNNGNLVKILLYLFYLYNFLHLYEMVK